jgi:hypothetical protein
MKYRLRNRRTPKTALIGVMGAASCEKYNPEAVWDRKASHGSHS